MTDQDWIKKFPGSVTVCDAAGVILEMNDMAAETFAMDGGKALIETIIFAIPCSDVFEMIWKSHFNADYVRSQKKFNYFIQKLEQSILTSR